MGVCLLLLLLLLLLLPPFFLETLFVVAYVVVVVVVTIIVIIIIVIIVIILVVVFVVVIIVILITASAARRGGKVLVFIVATRPTRLRGHASATRTDVVRGSLGQSAELARSRNLFLAMLPLDKLLLQCRVVRNFRASDHEHASRPGTSSTNPRDPRSTTHDACVSGRVPEPQGTPQREGTARCVARSDILPFTRFVT